VRGLRLVVQQCRLRRADGTLQRRLQPRSSVRAELQARGDRLLEIYVG
jgi:hypothetical protein